MSLEPCTFWHDVRLRRPAAPDVIRRPLGRIAFANAELHGHQNWRDAATAEGKRAVEQL